MIINHNAGGVKHFKGRFLNGTLCAGRPYRKPLILKRIFIFMKYNQDNDRTVREAAEPLSLFSQQVWALWWSWRPCHANEGCWPLPHPLSLFATFNVFFVK